MTGSLQGRIALVTGAAHNLGRAIALRLSADGAMVVAHARTPEDAETAASAVRLAGGEAVPLAFDLADPTEIEHGFDRLDALGLLADTLVLNAAHLGLNETPTLHQSFGFFDEVMAVNVTGAHRAALLAARRLTAATRPGAIVMISSLAGERAIHGRLAYNTSKAAVDGLVRSLALELAPHAIRVNGIAPGYVWSDRWAEIGEDEIAERRSLIPAGVETAQDEIARLAAYLVSDASPTLTGERIVIDGGLAAQQSPAGGGVSRA